MSDKKYKLIAIDLDGTLLNEEKEISQKNKDAIKKCIDNDVKIVISSGRAKENITMFMKELGITSGYGSAFHGSTIFKAEDFTIVNETFLNDEIAKEILSKINVNTNVGILAYTQQSLYTTNLNEEVEKYHRNKKVKVTTLNNFYGINEPISKILVKGERKVLDEIKASVMMYEDRCKILFSELDLLEFTSLQTNKGFSLEKIAELYNINIKDTIGIGDNYNDMEMIEKAGLGVAVQNAVPELKQKADYVTQATNEEDAISEVINKFIVFN